MEETIHNFTTKQEPMTTPITNDDLTSHSPKIVTPSSPSGDNASEVLRTSSREEELERELKEIRRDAEQAGDALENLVEGVRLVKRILERSASEESQQKGISKLDCRGTQDLKRAHEISTNLHGVLGSDFLALINAADMVREHAKLAADESANLVLDTQKAQEEAVEASSRACRAEKVGGKLYRENLTLKKEIAKLRAERRALGKEVKVLREKAEETKKFDTWRLLEQHVLGSMAMHEMILKTPTSPKENLFKEESTSSVTTNDGEDFVALNVGPNGDPTVTPEKDQAPQGRGQRETLQVTPNAQIGTNRNKTPTPSLEEITASSTVDSSCDTPKDDATEVGRQMGKDKFSTPLNVAFDARNGPMRQYHISPMQSPDELRSATPDLKPICDPDVLRTLAIPSPENGDDSKETRFSSPRIRVGPGLYEC